MSAEPTEPTSALSPDLTGAKRPWHAPEVQQVDVVETELGNTTYVDDLFTNDS